MEPKPGPDQNLTHDQAPGRIDAVPDGLIELCFCHRLNRPCTGNDRQIFALLKDKKIDAAYSAAGHAVIANPRCWKTQRALAHCFLQQHRAQFAVTHFAAAISLFRVNDGKPSGFIKNLLTEHGRACMQDGRLAPAKDSFERALVYDPPYLPAKVGLAEVIERETAAGARGFNGHKLLDEGHRLERAGQYGEAWDCYTRAKKDLQGRGFKYDRAPVVARFNAYKSHCTGSIMRRLDRIARETWPGAQLLYEPIFILGYPRSGTTLLEQMLAAAPGVTPGGEFPFIVDLVNSCRRFLQSDLPYPFCLDELEIADTRIALQNMRNHYFARVVERIGPPARASFVTDKMPLNECYLPLLHLLFPYAPKILIRRDPLDVIVSNFSLFLTHGSHQADSPESCADHIGLVNDLVNHYRRKMAGVGLNLIDCSYEDLVRQPEIVLKRICGTAGLDFVPAMLSPEKVGRYAHTASYAQVREPISDKSVGRWRRFSGQLAAAGIDTGNM